MSAENQERAQYLLKEVTETRAVEHKSWIDPQTPEGTAKLIRALIALRNNVDGGALVIGVDDKNRTLLPPPQGMDIRQTFKRGHHSNITHALRSADV
jgi:predicted HTH transcriptional regulator